MNDWREQLKNVYEVLRDRKKATKPSSTTKFDQEVNFKGRAGYNDTGIPLSPKTIKQKNKNKSMYAARARAKYWSAGSQLKNINDRRAADAASKYGVKVPEALMPEAVEIAKQKKAERMRELQKDLMKGRSPLTNYGTFFNESSRGYGSPSYHSARADIMQPDKFRNRQRVEYKHKKGPYEI